MLSLFFKRTGLLFALGLQTTSVILESYYLSEQKQNRKFFCNYRQVNTPTRTCSNKELLELWILLLINNSYLPHDIWFLQILIRVSIFMGPHTWIWILLAKNLYSDCAYALEVSVPFPETEREEHNCLSLVRKADYGIHMEITSQKNRKKKEREIPYCT